MLKSMNFLSGKSRGRVGGGGGLSPLAPVILCLVHRILFQQGFNLVNKFALLLNKCWFTQDSWDKPKNDGCRGRGFSVFFQSGRSIIEMLGVLAIIGVLSIGGIAGYSKAMEKWKINKTIEEYSALMTGLIEYKDNFIKNSEKEKQIGLGEFIFAAHLVPESWGLSNNIITDTNGNGMTAYFVKGRDERFVFDVRFARAKSNKSSFSTNLCVAFFKDIGKPLAYMMNAIFITSTQVEYAGEGHCHFGDTSVDGYPLRCLNDMTLSEMMDACQKCTEQACVIYFVF